MAIDRNDFVINYPSYTLLHPLRTHIHYVFVPPLAKFCLICEEDGDDGGKKREMRWREWYGI